MTQRHARLGTNVGGVHMTQRYPRLGTRGRKTKRYTRLGTSCTMNN